jgi:predicted TIM-barrel fold metal-dependent hydrolase
VVRKCGRNAQVKGIRQIINHHPENPGLTWPKVHSGDYLTTDEKFRHGYSLLQKYGLSFDLQVTHTLTRRNQDKF